MNFTIPSKAIAMAGKAVTTVKKYSPQIMMVVGTITSVAAVFEAVKQTPKAMEYLEEHKAEAEAINEAHELALQNNDDDYSEKDYKKDLAELYVRTGKNLARTFAMPVLMEATSLLCFFGAHRVMTDRNKMLSTALAASTDAFNRYRNKVIDAVGEEKEEQIRLGTTSEKITKEITDENGKTKKITEKVEVVNPNNLDCPYDIIWEFGDPGYDQSEELRAYHIQEVQNMYNKMLFEKGLVSFVSLNDVRKYFKNRDEALIPLGQIVGWDKESDDGAIIIRSKDVMIKDPETGFLKDVTILSPNISGSIVRDFIK